MDLVHHDQAGPLAGQLDASAFYRVGNLPALTVNGKDVTGFETFLMAQIDNKAAVLGNLDRKSVV